MFQPMQTIRDATDHHTAAHLIATGRLWEAFGQKVEEAAETLQAICNMKFGGADRTPLYNLGLQNAEIDREDTSLLAMKMLKAAKDK